MDQKDWKKEKENETLDPRLWIAFEEGKRREAKLSD